MTFRNLLTLSLNIVLKPGAKHMKLFTNVIYEFSDAPIMGRPLALLTNIRLGLNGLPGQKLHLLRILVKYGRKKFYRVGPWSAITRNASLKRYSCSYDKAPM